MGETLNAPNPTSVVPSKEELGFDPDALRDKYAAERDRRVRADGNDQYKEFKGEFERLGDDPFVETPIERAPMEETLDALVIGGGFGGMIAAVELQKIGITDFRMIEKASDFGGTWYWNRYPGAQCDVESYIYLPFLEETGYVPKEKYSFGPEIFAHAQRAGRHFKLYERACFQTQVKSARWQEDDKRWLVETDRGDKFRARYLIMSAGPLNKAKLPAMKGLDRFKGHMFHTSRWDYDYTGGDTTGGLTGLADKRVGIVGTGATGIQCVPRVADYAKELFVFQRTPSAVDERRNSPTDAAWAESLTPGWRKRRADNFTAICGGVPQEEDLIGDGWTELFSRLTNPIEGYDPATLTEEDVGALAEIGDFQHMNQIRNRVDAVVGNADLAEKLKPWYRQLCKRPTFNDEFLPAFNRPNVTLVDTSAGKGLEQVTENGVVVDGQEYELDCLIFATGFEVGTAYSRRSELELYGRGGIALTEHWADATKTFHGMYTSKFPNWFQIGHTQTAINPNAITMFEDQMEHIAYVITEARNRGATTVEVTPEAENAWVDRVRAPNPVTEMVKTCTPGYYNNEGKPGQGAGLFEEFFAEGPMVFRQVLSDWRNEGSLEGLRLE